jgi:hypothetical protein
MNKTATQTKRQTSGLDPSDRSTAGAMHTSASTGAENAQDLAQLVWKYFGEEISETLKEVQATLAPHKYGSNNT